MTHNHRSTTHKERFIHVRPQQGLTPKYSAATIFIRLEEDGKWYASRALCWAKDQFNRATGRKNSRRHYFENKKVEIGEKFEINNVIKTVLSDICVKQQCQC